jgi:C4-dicarboxylate transporter DctM subunit
MSPELQIIVVFAVFLGLLTIGMSIPFAISVPAVLYLMLQGGIPALKSLGLVSWANLNSFVLTAIPLFILMAEIMQRSGLTLRVYRGLAMLVAPIPGGLLQTNIAGCAVFAAVSGSSVATAASIGSVSLPQLISRKYDRKLSAGSLAAGGTLGILIPPSLAMIVYASFTETSVAKLFIAGVVPGLLLTLMFMAYIAFEAWRRPEIAPKEKGPQNLQEWKAALIDIFPFFVIVGGTIGSIYAGIMTPTEAAALGCVLALVLSAMFGEVTLPLLREALVRTVEVCANIIFIIYAAYVFSHAISYGGIGEKIVKFVIDLNLTKTQFLIALFFLYTILGCLIESLGMIVITVPLLHPVVLNYGIDPILFGILLVIYIELGQISPPIGINLFVIQSIWDGDLGDVVLGTIPFHIIMFVLLAMVMIWPEIAMWLPTNMK